MTVEEARAMLLDEEYTMNIAECREIAVLLGELEKAGSIPAIACSLIPDSILGHLHKIRVAARKLDDLLPNAQLFHERMAGHPLQEEAVQARVELATILSATQEKIP